MTQKDAFGAYSTLKDNFFLTYDI